MHNSLKICVKLNTRHMSTMTYEKPQKKSVYIGVL